MATFDYQQFLKETGASEKVFRVDCNKSENNNFEEYRIPLPDHNLTLYLCLNRKDGTIDVGYYNPQKEVMLNQDSPKHYHVKTIDFILNEEDHIKVYNTQLVYDSEKEDCE